MTIELATGITALLIVVLIPALLWWAHIINSRELADRKRKRQERGEA